MDDATSEHYSMFFCDGSLAVIHGLGKLAGYEAKPGDDQSIVKAVA